MAPEDSPLSVLAYQAAGTEAAFDGSVLRPGVHLRWFPQPDLGFPANGFTISRSTVVTHEFGGEWTDWQSPLTDGPLRVTLPVYDAESHPAPGGPFPDEAEEIRRRIRDGFHRQVDATHAERIEELATLLHRVIAVEPGDNRHHERPLVEEAADGSPQLRALDALHLLALDPTLARVLGLSWTDSTIPPGVPVAYRIVGRWGATKWPEYVLTFDEVPVHAFDDGTFSHDGVEIHSNRRIRLLEADPPSNRARLRFTGYNLLPVRFTFPRPVEEARFRFDYGFTGPEHWSVDAATRRWHLTVDVTAQGRDLFVRSPSGIPFEHVTLTGTETVNAGPLTLVEVGHRERVGAIGSQETIAVLGSGAVPYDDPNEGLRNLDTASVFEYPTREEVVVPTLADAAVNSVPPRLNGSGQVSPNPTQVRVHAQVDDAVDGYDPVRLHVRRSRYAPWSPSTTVSPRGSRRAGAGGLVGVEGLGRLGGLGGLGGADPRVGVGIGGWNTTFLPILLSQRIGTMPDPVVHPRIVPITAWSLDGTLTGTVAHRSLRWRGPTGPRYGRIDGDRRSLVCYGRDYAEMSDGPFRSLGSSLVIQAWVRPYSTTGFRTIVGNNRWRSFWLALFKDTNQLRAWLYTDTAWRPFLSRKGVPVNRWSHVALIYDGKHVRFYIDGELDSEHDAPLGPILPNPHGQLRVGADWNNSGETDTYFQGELADVQLFQYRRDVATAETETLVAKWAFEGDTTETRSQSSVSHGSVQFERGHPENHRRHFLSLDGAGFVSLPGRAVVRQARTHLTLSAWIRPDANRRYPTIVGNSHQESFWLGLTLSTTTAYRLRFWLHGVEDGGRVESRGTVPAGVWTHVAVTYDGELIRFYIDGVLDTSHDAPFGPVRPNRTGDLCVGAESGSREGDIRFPFRGGLAGVHVWAAVPAERPVPLYRADLLAWWPLDGDTTDVQADRVATVTGDLTFETGFDGDATRTALTVDGRGYLDVADRSDLQSLGAAMTLEAWVHPNAWSSTVVGNGRESGFSLELGAGGTLDFWLANRRYRSEDSVPRNRWSHVVASYDGGAVELSVNGRRTTHEAVRGPIPGNPTERLTIGAGAASTPDALVAPFSGQLAEVRLWNRALSLRELERAVERVAPPTQYTDYDVPDGEHQYALQGIDAFGRVSRWGVPRQVVVAGRSPPPEPVGVQATYVPLIGHLTAPPERITLDDRRSGWRLVTDIDLPRGITAAGDGSRTALERYDLHVSGQRTGVNGTAVEAEQSFEISRARPVDGSLIVDVTRPAAPRLDPRETDSVRIDIDYRLDVQWGWTGRQRLFWPRTREFRLYHEPRALNRLQGTVTETTERGAGRYALRVELAAPHTLNADDLEDTACQIDGRRYTVESNDPVTGRRLWLRVHTFAVPAPEPALGATWRLTLPPTASGHRAYRTASAWETRLAVEPVDVADPSLDIGTGSTTPLDEADLEALRTAAGGWLPSLDDDLTAEASRIHRLALPDMRVETATPEAYVPGVVVGRTTTAPPKWVTFDVVWADDSPPSSTLYLRVDDVDIDNTDPQSFHELRYHPGQRYHADLVAPVAFAPGTVDNAVVTPAPGQATAEQALGVTAADDRRTTTDTRGDPARYGNESGVSSPVSLVAVDRRRPPQPPRPSVELGRADYYGLSTASVSWDPVAEPGVAYNLYRALDRALYDRDRDQRMRGDGYYAGATTGQRVGMGEADRDDFVAWLTAAFPDEAVTTPGDGPRWQTTLFLDEGGTDDAETRRIWRAWSEWFYPSLDDAEITELAERAGNEAAFALVTESPVTDTTYDDAVRGDVRNRYLYRVETVSPAGTLSAALGPVSVSGRSPSTPLRPPRITRVEPGDRAVTVRWALDTSPDVAAYRLYRAEADATASLDEAKAKLDDLRYWGVDDTADDRFVATVPNPLLRVSGRSVRLPPTLDVQSVLGVYRVDEFDRTRDSFDQQSCLNYVPAESSASETVTGLRRIPDGTAVVVVYRDGDGAVRVADRAPVEIRSRRPDSDIERFRVSRTGLSPITVQSGGIRLPSGLGVSGVVGVYRASEFDAQRHPPTDQPDAANHVTSETTVRASGDSSVVVDNAPLTDGTPVVVAYRRDGDIRTVDSRIDSVADWFRDEGLQGASNYAYRLAAVAGDGRVSDGSTVVVGRPVERTRPEPPTVELQREPQDAETDRVTLTGQFDSPLDIAVERRLAPTGRWQTVVGWQRGEPPVVLHDDVNAPDEFEYRMWGRTLAGVPCDEPPISSAVPAERPT